MCGCSRNKLRRSSRRANSLGTPSPPRAARLTGHRLSPEERTRIAGILSRFTDLSEDYIERTNLRIEASRFRKELLRSEHRTVGRLDSRFKGVGTSAAAERPDFDPSMAAIRPPYTAAFNDYVRQELGYENDRRYYVLGEGFDKWEWGSGRGFPDTSEALRSAMAKNPYMKVFVDLDGRIRSGPHDVHPEEISREAEGRCDGFHRGSQREPPADD